MEHSQDYERETQDQETDWMAFLLRGIPDEVVEVLVA